MSRCGAMRIAGLLLFLSLCTSSAKGQLQQSVGKGGVNRADDVRLVQKWLNQVSDLSGGPERPLAEDGRIGARTIAAISRFQQFQLGFSDGRIDRGQHSELRLMRLNGIHEVLGTADSPEEKKLAEFTSQFSVILVSAGGKAVAVRPPYHINAGKRKARAEDNRAAAPVVQRLIRNTLSSSEAAVGKAKPDQIRRFLQAALDAGLIESQTPDDMRAFLAKFDTGIFVDDTSQTTVIGGTLYQGNFQNHNLLDPTDPLDVVNKANTTFLAKLRRVGSPIRLRAGDLMVKGGSHVRLITDVDRTESSIEFTTLESTASEVLPNGNGIGERRWRFQSANDFSGLQLKRGGKFVDAAEADAAYIYTRK